MNLNAFPPKRISPGPQGTFQLNTTFSILASIFKEIESSALKLNKKQRAQLASRLLESLEKHKEPGVEQAWLDEIDRRNRQFETGEIESIPIEETLSKARKLIS